VQFRDRIIDLRRVKASELLANPKNWRTHPAAQKAALTGVLTEIGYADALLARKLPDGSLELIDGHLRAETTPDAMVPVLVLDVDEAEAGKLLATLDPLAAMAEADAVKLDQLLQEIDTGSEALQQMLADLAVDNGVVPKDEQPTELRQIETKPPPRITWVMLGIPTVRFGEIAEAVEGLAAIDGVTIETTSNDG